jgi:hypothetical protein
MMNPRSRAHGSIPAGTMGRQRSMALHSACNPSNACYALWRVNAVGTVASALEGPQPQI